ncbi:MAG: hypothetical protein AAF577_06835 [Pseudomonadota bacterium]
MADDITLPSRSSTLPGPVETMAGLRNSALDATLYGIAGLTAVERGLLAPGTGTPGAVVLAKPGREEAPGVRVFADARAFLDAAHGAVTQFAVPGGGGSELAAAALARHVADATGHPTAAVVPGYGRQDAVAEALGGAVLFAPMARLRTALGTLARQTVAQAAGQRMPGRRVRLRDDVLTAPAIAALVTILGDQSRRVDLLVAHAQGALTLSAALARVMRERRGARAADAQIVTLAAPTAFPVGVRWLHQVRGALDPLAALNAESEVAHDILPMVGHHMNPAIPGYLSLRRVLDGLGGSTR